MNNMKNGDNKEIYNECLNEFRILIINLRRDFIKHNSTPIPGIFDSRELSFYLDGAMDVLDNLEKTLQIAYQMSRSH
jgi:hypothetical protein